MLTLLYCTLWAVALKLGFYYYRLLKIRRIGTQQNILLLIALILCFYLVVQLTYVLFPGIPPLIHRNEFPLIQ